MIAIAALLGVNTVVCVAARLARALRHRSLSTRSLSAHLAHLGFLLVLAAHLIGSVAGFRSDGHSAFNDGRISVPARPGWSIEVGRVSASFAPQGYPTDLDAELSVGTAGRLLARGTARVNHPLMVDGVALYLKNAEPSPRGCGVQIGAEGPAFAEVGRPLTFAAGTLLLSEWARTPQGPAVRIAWTPAGGVTQQGWLPHASGRSWPLPGGAVLIWGEIEIDTLGTFDVRYDPGAPLALAGGILLSGSLLPLLWPRRRLATPAARIDSPTNVTSDEPEPA
jgi:hypothetical protein